MSKFSKIPVQSLFRVRGELMLKTSPVTFVSVEDPVIGERMIEPMVEDGIEILDSDNTSDKITKAQKRVEGSQNTGVIQTGPPPPKW